MEHLAELKVFITTTDASCSDCGERLDAARGSRSSRTRVRFVSPAPISITSLFHHRAMLALELRDSVVILDDDLARRVAKALKIRPED